MSKRPIFGIVLIILLTGVLLLPFNVQIVKAGVGSQDAISGKIEILEPLNGSNIIGSVEITFAIENNGGYVEFLPGDITNRIDLEIEYESTSGFVLGWGLMFWSTSVYGLSLQPGERYEETLIYDPSDYEDIVPELFIGYAPYEKTVIRLVHWQRVGDEDFPYGEFGQFQISVVFVLPEDLNGDMKIDIEDIATAAVALGSYPTHPRWNSKADMNQDGRVDIRDVVSIAGNFGEAYSLMGNI